MVERCWQKDQERITIDKQTVSQRLASVQSQAQSNAKRNEALSAEESESLISYAVNIAQRGFPLTPHWLGELANEILKAHDGDNFKLVGRNWASRFVEKHSNQLKMYWSHPLDHS